jgi:predicted murein hydrolase (TIGR00659 family)
MEQLIKAGIIILMTVAIYLITSKIYQRFQLSILNPVITTTLIVSILILTFPISYDTYMIGGKWLNFLLGPAVVAFAYNLYNHRTLLFKYITPIVLGVTVGTIVGMISGGLLTLAFGVKENLTLSMVPKSLTIPVAVQIATTLGGIGPITAVFVMFAGYSGIILGPVILKKFGVHSSIGKGVGFGTASQAVGVVKALEHSELSGSIGTVSMALSAIVGSFLAPLIVNLFGLS